MLRGSPWLALGAALGLLTPSSSRAEGQLWSEVGVSYRVERNLELQFDQHLRLDRDGSRLDQVIPELGIRLRVSRHLRLGAAYRFEYERSASGDFEPRHRLQADAMVRARFESVRADLRMRVQEGFGDKGVRYGLRSRLRLRWALNKQITPMAATELFFRFGFGERLWLRAWRVTLGSDVELDDHTLELFYRVEVPVGDNDDPTWHILGLGYHYDLEMAEEKANGGSEELAIGAALLINPIAPLLGPFGWALADADVVDASFRVHHAVTERIGVSVAPEFAYSRLVFNYYFLGVKVGPRLSLSGPGLEGWYLFPMGIFGWGWADRHTGEPLFSVALLGAGVEAGYAWCWRGFVLELGAGAQVSTFLGYSTSWEGLADRGTASAWPVKPMVNTSIGYGW